MPGFEGERAIHEICVVYPERGKKIIWDVFREKRCKFAPTARALGYATTAGFLLLLREFGYVEELREERARFRSRFADPEKFRSTSAEKAASSGHATRKDGAVGEDGARARHR